MDEKFPAETRAAFPRRIRGAAPGAEREETAPPARSRSGSATDSARATEPRPLPGPTLPAWASLALLLVGATWLYLPAIRVPFFADDFLFLDQVRGRGLIEAISTPDPLSNFFRPVSRQIYFWIIAGLTHESPVAFHVASVASFLILLALLFTLAHRLAGTLPALIATAFVALHYSAEVAVRWACGSQELLAVAGALAALLLHVNGRRLWAGVALTLAALSKEIILLTPLIAVAADRRPGEPWTVALRRAWPLGAAVAVWALLWLAMPRGHVAQATEVDLDPTSPLAAIVHLVQVAFGAEWRRGELGHLPRVLPALAPLALALAAVAWAAPRGAGSVAAGAAEPLLDRRRAMVVGCSWAVLGALPVTAVAILWSAHYYLFAICGVGLALGAWLAPLPRVWAVAALAALAWGSASARALDEFAVPRDPWTSQSHLNRFYIDRASRYCSSYLASLRRKHPTLPHSSTLFFGGLRGNVAFQAADGPLVRWAYRDRTLRSHYLNTFSRDKVGRGPLYFFVGSADTLIEMDQGPDIFLRIAHGMIVSGKPGSARDALTLERDRHPGSSLTHYWLAWAEWASGDSAAALGSLERAGVNLSPGPAPEIEPALALVAEGDTLGAMRLAKEAVARHGLDPAAHALLADLHLIADPDRPDGAIEALAARVLAPVDPYAWRRWAMVQTHARRYLEALESFERYFALAGSRLGRDEEVERWVRTIRGLIPGGDLATEGLRE